MGAVQHELINAGVQQVTSVEASSAYLNAAKEEAQRRRLADHVSYYHGNFADLASDIAPADIVTLDRVICCYHDMEKLVGLSAARARKLVWPGLPARCVVGKDRSGYREFFLPVAEKLLPHLFPPNQSCRNHW